VLNQKTTRLNLHAVGVVSCSYLLLLSTCLFAQGGGGSAQTAPDSVKAGEPAVIRLELSVWGAGGDIKGRYTDLAASYRLVGESDLKRLSPRFISRDAKHEVYEFTIPGYPKPTTGKIEYYIELKLDGYPSRIEGIKKIKVIQATGLVFCFRDNSKNFSVRLSATNTYGRGKLFGADSGAW